MKKINGKKYMIIGAARSGISAAAYLSDKAASVTLTDTKSLESLKSEGYGIERLIGSGKINLLLGRQPTGDEVCKADEIILSPGVPPDIEACRIAQQKGINVVSEVEFAVRYFNGDIVAITGTNGKTTTTYLCAALLSAAGKKAFVCGNIGLPFIDYVEKTDKNSIAALEISSFQLSMCDKMKPKIAVITNITPDHLDRHKTMDNYIAAKANVFKNMDENGMLVLNYDDNIVRELSSKAKCRIKYFSLQNTGTDAYLKDGVIYLKGIGKVIDVSEMKILGPHNAANAMCALLCAIEYGCDIEKITQALKQFSPVEHRVEFVRELNGVKYINDSKGTNPDATITAVRSFDCPLIMILGGYDKHNSFDELFELLKGKTRHIYVLGQTADEIIRTAEKHGFMDYSYVESLEEAVNKAHETAQSGDCVLLSPACASWGMFDNFEQRGQLFKDYVNKLG